MAKSDNELLDNALDAAEEKLTAKVEAEPVVEKEPVKEVPEPEETKESASEEEQISDQEASVEVTDPDPTPDSPAVETVSAPAYWTAKTKALFSSASPELQKALTEEATRQQQHMGRLANETQRAKSWETRVNSDFQNKEALDTHRATLKLLGVNDEIEELHRYRAWNSVIKSDPLSAVRSLIVQHGITPDELSGESFSEDQNQGAIDPRVDEIASELKRFREEQEQSKKSQQDAYFANQVNTWKSGNDSYGKPRAEFSSLYAPQIDSEWQQVLQEAGQSGAQMSLEDSLNEAFSRVQSRIYKAHGINPVAPKPPTKEQIIANASKVQAAVTKATGAPRSDVVTQRPKKKYKNDKEWVEAAMQRAEEKRGSLRN